MKTTPIISILVLCLIFISGCMPASFTKWKQDAPTTKKPTSVFTDTSGNPVPSGNLSFPTYISYHVIPNPTAFPASTAATTTMTFSPKTDGDLSGGYPWGTNAQALDPLFTVEDLAVPYNCGGTLLGLKGAVSNISINSSSGVVSLAPAVLNAATPETREYCLKLRYKTPTITAPGYSYAYLYGVLKIKILSPLSTLDFKQSTHLKLELSTKVDLGQFTINNTITASPSGAIGSIDYYDSLNSLLYVTATTTTTSKGFRPNDQLTVASGGIGAPYYDAKIANVTNIYAKATSSSIPNVTSYPLASASSLAANGVTFSLSSNVGDTSSIISFDTTTATFNAINSTAANITYSYNISATNDLGSVTIPFSYMVANGFAPLQKAGILKYPHSSTLTLSVGDISGNFNDFAETTAISSNGATAIIYSKESSSSAKSLTVVVTATGTRGFEQGEFITASNGTSKAIINKVKNVFLVNTSSNILTYTGTSFLPYWTQGNQIGNSVTYSLTGAPAGAPDGYTSNYLSMTSSITGDISGFSPKASELSLTVTATNTFGEVRTDPFFFSFVLKGDVPLSLSYVQRKVAGCNSRLKLNLSGYSGSLSSIFSTGQKIWANNAVESTSATPTYIGSNYIIVDIEAGYFKKNMLIDTGSSTYTVPRATISKVINVFDKNVALCTNQIVPILEPTGEIVTYNLTPDFPSSALGLTFDTASGTISGTPTSNFAESDYTVEASNSSGKASADFSFLVSSSPKGLSYSRQVILNVDLGTEFYAGSSISSKNPDASGVIRQKVNLADGTAFLVVDVVSGKFVQNASVDKYATYKDPRAQILSVTNNTFSITYTGVPALTSSAIGQYVYNSSGVKQAIITQVSTGQLFLRLVKGSFAVSDTFCVTTDALLSSCSSSPYTISTINAPSLTLTNSAFNAAFTVGDTILSSTALGANYASLMITATTAATARVDVLTQSFNTLGTGDNLYYGYSGVLAPVTISGIAHNHTLYMYQNESVSIAPNIMEGDSVVYSQTGSLPPGLTFNTSTGEISGTVANSTTGTSTPITISATNFMGTTSHTFQVKAFRHFQVDVQMTEAPSMITHREGRVNNVTPCRVTWEQTQTTNNDKNILCRVEAGEIDLYKEGVDFQIFSGKNMCEKVVYYPSYFWAYPVGKTNYQYAYHYDCSCTNKTIGTVAHPGCNNVNNGLQAPGDAASFSMRAGPNYYDKNGAYIKKSKDLCTYNYIMSNGDALDCDEGLVRIYDRKFIDDPNDAGLCTGRPGAASCADRKECEDAAFSCGGTATGTAGTWTPDCVQDADLADLTVKEYCEGKAYNCVEGGVKDLFGETEFTSGLRGQIESTVNGYPTPGYKSYKIASPLSKGYGTNLRVANYTNRNSCSNGSYNYYADNWTSYANTTTSATDPWGNSQPFYVFLCLDAAGDTKAKIRIQVREWNRAVDVFNDIDNIIPASTLMDDRSADPIMGGNYNNFADWDDDYTDANLNGLRNEEAGSHSLNNCNAGAPTPGTRYPFPTENR